MREIKLNVKLYIDRARAYQSKTLSPAQCPSRFPFISNREFRIANFGLHNPHSAFRNPRFLLRMSLPDAPSQPPQRLALEMRQISKSFGSTQALRTVDFELRPGDIHALMGENGAGKSTLMKIAG